ncbi:putative colanic acid biosynthesis acetyltransferase [Rhodopirellula sp. MGV]|nr:putative colanic acid biosynthesis acetyltransferase [Rhodopirellula sp. MGV]PNY35590.1 putative colanic acid biosynthesis acetyltransferase [Rhodopirellula baltica]
MADNRRSRKWTRLELLGRMLWALAGPLFRYSPRPCWGWRRFLLRRFGAQIGHEARIDPSARIFIPWNLAIGDWSSLGFDCLIYNLGPMTIGDRVTVSQRSHLCGGTHDYSDGALPLIKSPITVQDDAWVCADSFIGPGVTIATGCIVAARAVVIRSTDAWSIVGGHPAKKIKPREPLVRPPLGSLADL